MALLLHRTGAEAREAVLLGRPGAWQRGAPAAARPGTAAKTLEPCQARLALCGNIGAALAHTCSGDVFQGEALRSSFILCPGLLLSVSAAASLTRQEPPWLSADRPAGGCSTATSLPPTRIPAARFRHSTCATRPPAPTQGPGPCGSAGGRAPALIRRVYTSWEPERGAVNGAQPPQLSSYRCVMSPRPARSQWKVSYRRGSAPLHSSAGISKRRRHNHRNGWVSPEKWSSAMHSSEGPKEALSSAGWKPHCRPAMARKAVGVSEKS